MSDQVSAIGSWLSGALGLPCHTEGDVPETQALPYATHRIPVGSFGDTSSCEVDVWCRQGHAAEADGYAERLRDALGPGGAMVRCDGGAVLLRRGTPFSQPLPDDRAERRYINVDIDYLTSD